MKKWMVKLGVVCMAGSLLVGCGGKRADSNEMNYATTADIEAYDYDDMALNDSGAGFAPEEAKEAEEARDAASDDGSDISISTVDNLNRKIIKEGHLNIETKNFKESVEKIQNEIESLGGFQEHMSLEEDYASIVARIPEKSFDSFLNHASEYGNVISKSASGKDVTDQYVDKELRIKTLKVQEERLSALLEKSGTLEELFQIEQEMANVRYELEKITGELKKYDSLIEFSTVNIKIRNVEIYNVSVEKESFGERMKYRFTRSVERLKENVEEFVLDLVSFAPSLVIWIPIILIITMIVKKIRKKNKAKMKQGANKETNKKTNKDNNKETNKDNN